MTLSEAQHLAAQMFRALASGFLSAADYMADVGLPYNPFEEMRPGHKKQGPKEEKEEENILAINYNHATREELLAAIRALNPTFNIEGCTLQKLRVAAIRAVALRKSEQLRELPLVPSEMSATEKPGANFKPPGIDTNPAVVKKAEQLQVFLDTTAQGEQKAKIFAHQEIKDCDLLCVRPGGSCPETMHCCAMLNLGDYLGQ